LTVQEGGKFGQIQQEGENSTVFNLQQGGWQTGKKNGVLRVEEHGKGAGERFPGGILALKLLALELGGSGRGC
jgi:hypothetical protein